MPSRVSEHTRSRYGIFFCLFRPFLFRFVRHGRGSFFCLRRRSDSLRFRRNGGPSRRPFAVCTTTRTRCVRHTCTNAIDTFSTNPTRHTRRVCVRTNDIYIYNSTLHATPRVKLVQLEYHSFSFCVHTRVPYENVGGFMGRQRRQLRSEEAEF